jgi:hypothetical protein
MSKGTLGSLTILLCAVVLAHQPAWGQANVLAIACEGTESNGGGATTFQYALVNTGTSPVTLTLFYVGTMDLNPPNYTGWVAPPGFSPVGTVGPWIALPDSFSVMYTTQVKTPHGIVPPTQAVAAPGAVAWFGSAVMNPNVPLTFGFDNPHTSWDMEWFTEHPSGANVTGGLLGVPIAGPSGVFTQGYVHGPTIEPSALAPTTFGRIKALYR